MYNKTIQGLVEVFGHLPNRLIAAVLVVDDSSSAIDRQAMMDIYPSFTYIYKSMTDTGHASSLNILIRLIRTRYFIYLEDDWVINSDPSLTMSSTYSQSILDIEEQILRYVDKGREGYSVAVTGYAVLVSSLGVLGYVGDVVIPHPLGADHDDIVINIKHVNPSREDVHQVLFNEQGSRDCAQGHDDCDVAALGQGGWHRDVCQSYDTTPFNDTAYTCIPYSLHEFGYISSSDTGRIHDFSVWPGFSFNPGMWDITSIVSAMGDVISHNNGDLFVDKDTRFSFEQLFSSQAYVSGLNMGYLHMVLFKHVGDVSAYDMNNISRPWTG